MSVYWPRLQRLVLRQPSHWQDSLPRCALCCAGVIPWIRPTDTQRDVWIAAGVFGGTGMSRLPCNCACKQALSCFTVGLVCAGAAIALFGAIRHLRHWNQPRIQRYFLRFHAAPIIFAICAMGGLLFPLCHAMFVFVRTWYVLGPCLHAYFELICCLYSQHDSHHRASLQ